MRVALAQINNHICDFEQNSQRIIQAIQSASKQRCDLVIFPELSLFGYWPADILERKYLVIEQLKYLIKIKKEMPKGIVALVGAVTKSSAKKGKPFNNSAVLLQSGKKDVVFSKELLPEYDIYDEQRHFSPGKLEKNIFKIKGKKVLVSICEDIWGWEGNWIGVEHNINPFLSVKKQKPSLVVNLSSSPFSIGKDAARKRVVTQTAKYLKAPVVYVNQMTANDEIIFDGGSFVSDEKGKIVTQSMFFEEDLNICDFAKKDFQTRTQTASPVELLRKALVCGIKNYLDKNNIKKVHLGISGGIDSALVACLACEAIGPGRVTLIALPGPFSTQESFDLALKLSENLKCQFMNIDINGMYRTCTDEFETSFGIKEFGVTHENLQSRLRGMTLMAYSNFKNSMLLTTGNKSEYATGYATLYGDMCGGLAPIGDLLKHQVYELCANYNRNGEVIPQGIIDRAPTAELRENQKDEDSLPPYSELDKMVDDFIVKNKEPKSAEEKEIYAKIMKAEFKRRQAAPILRVSDHAFGSGRRYPLSWRS
jgi:NAD+ synthase (glutamine-hydrolysing)